ncbi:MAG: hypothetical protein IT204_01905 [Fimbriimonadaceae bacterium]|nr:hypothetical protein [Fimbriimonadaceae bacterium]
MIRKCGWPLLLGTLAWSVLPAQTLTLQPAQVSHAVAVIGEPVEIAADLANNSGDPVAPISAELLLPTGWRADPVRIDLPSLAPYTRQRLRFHAVADAAGHGGGRVMISAPGLLQPLAANFPVASVAPLSVLPSKWSMRERSMGMVSDDGTIYVTTGSYIVFLPNCGGDRGPGLIYVRRGEEWERVATFPAMGRIIYEDGPPQKPVIAEHWIFPTTWWIPRDPAGDYLMTLKETWQDGRGRRWMAKMWLGPTKDPRVVKCTHAFWCDGEVKLRRYEGPLLNVGDGTFRGARAALLAPGVPAAQTDPVLLRAGQVEQGVVAVERPNGGVIGMLWDPSQLWVAGKATPQVLVASPNSLYRRDNHYVGLVVPHFAARQPADAVSAPSFKVPAKRPVYVRCELFASATGDVAEAAALWRDRIAGELRADARRPAPLP